jgi:hypothetical protein
VQHATADWLTALPLLLLVQPLGILYILATGGRAGSSHPLGHGREGSERCTVVALGDLDGNGQADETCKMCNSGLGSALYRPAPQACACHSVFLVLLLDLYSPLLLVRSRVIFTTRGFHLAKTSVPTSTQVRACSVIPNTHGLDGIGKN